MTGVLGTLTVVATGLIYSDRFLEHDTGARHPERPDRLRAICDRLRQAQLWDQLVPLNMEPISRAALERLHDPAYLDRLESACRNRASYIDAIDSAICPDSYDVALLAAGGVIAACDAVMAGTVNNAFCAVRPPGHHCERDRSMGFCLLGNIALAADHLTVAHGLERVAIVDWDVHHGNGTQHLLEDRGDILVINLHEHPSYLYPGTGYAWETGEGDGEGATLNLPMMPEAGDTAFRAAFQKKVLPALDAFSPQFLLISAGFDAAEEDPLAHLRVSQDGFQWMTRQLKDFADRRCDGRLVSVLEGGYHLRSLAEAVARHVGTLLMPAQMDDLMAMKAGF